MVGDGVDELPPQLQGVPGLGGDPVVLEKVQQRVEKTIALKGDMPLLGAEVYCVQVRVLSCSVQVLHCTLYMCCTVQVLSCTVYMYFTAH